MALRRVKLGECLELVEKRNVDGAYGVDDVRGVNNLKKMILTKADISARDLTKFQVVEPGVFFFNHRTSRNGSKFSITFNYDNETHITTEDYVLFRVKEGSGLSPMWLYLFVCRNEFDRYCIMNSWGSSTEFYNWEDFCDVELELPPIEVQQKYVAVYEAMLANQRSYEHGLGDLKLACDSYVEELMHQHEHERIAPYIFESDGHNGDTYGPRDVRGISISKKFIPTKAKMNGVSLANYKTVAPRKIAFVTVTSRNSNKITIALNESDDTYLVSATYIVFSCHEEKLLPEYLMLFFSRGEFDRYARFNSWGSARETFNWRDMQDVEIPIPDINTQQAIADIYKAYRQRCEINERLKAQIKDLCPILIKGSIDEARAS